MLDDAVLKFAYKVPCLQEKTVDTNKHIAGTIHAINIGTEIQNLSGTNIILNIDPTNSKENVITIDDKFLQIYLKLRISNLITSLKFDINLISLLFSFAFSILSPLMNPSDS